MACATLKRPMVWDPLNQQPSKRPCYHPSGQSGSGSCCVGAARNTIIQSNPILDAALGRISADEMAGNLRGEINRPHKPNQLPITSSALERMEVNESSDSEMAPEGPRRLGSPSNILSQPDEALFSFEQVQLICERMLQEREDKLREKYVTELTIKMAEQYDVFVKFTHDQILSGHEAAPSYLS